MRLLNFALIFCVILLTASAWEPIGPGTEYHYQRWQDNNDIFIVRVDRSNPQAIIDTMVGGDKIKGFREKTTSMYSRYDDSLTTWKEGKYDGTRYKAIAAVNGYYFNMQNGEWISGGLSNGWYVHRYDEMQAKPGFGSGYNIMKDKNVFIGECVHHTPNKNFVLHPKSGKKIPLEGLNIAPHSNKVILYTPQWDMATPPGTDTVELLIQLNRPAGFNSISSVKGTVTKIIKNKGGNVIPFDSIILNAGSSKVSLFNGIEVGDSVEVYQDVDEYDEGSCKNPISRNWDQTFSSLGIAYHYLKNGKRVIYNDSIRHPRTAMAYNSKYIYFYVVDGRTSKSQGMKIDELSDFALHFLNATDGAALDGGGSSTMVVNGKIRNFPSDGVERAVSNAVLIAVPVKEEFSTKFKSGENIIVKEITHLYIGPGRNFNKIEEIKEKTEGQIINHTLLGVKAKETFWWKVKIGQLEGWLDEARIAKK